MNIKEIIKILENKKGKQIDIKIINKNGNIDIIKGEKFNISNNEIIICEDQTNKNIIFNLNKIKNIITYKLDKLYIYIECLDKVLDLSIRI